MSGKTNTCGQFHRRGFTLVEVIVVITILLILSTGIVIGVSTWIHWSQFSEQNEYAQTLYSAAQNQITEYSAHGQLEMKVDEKVRDDDGDYYNVLDFAALRLIGSNGRVIELDDLWPARSGKTEKSKYTGRVCYAMGTAQDYALYRSDPNELDAQGRQEVRMMYDVLVPYLSDPSILEATVCLEFTPEDGQVYSVFYSNNAQNRENYFQYEDSGVTRGKVSIHSRQADYRSDRMVGYYGADSLSHATGVNAEKPSFSDVKLNNEETLNFSFRVSDVEESVNRMTYTIGVYDKDTKKKRMELLLDGSRLSPAGMSGSYRPISCQIVRYSTDGRVWQRDMTSPAWVPVLIQQESDNTISLVLDGADLTASSKLYQMVSGELTEENNAVFNDAYNKYMNTYSFSRFGINPEEIYCTVQGAGSVYKTTTKKQSNSSSVYFDEKAKQEMENPDGSTGERIVYTISNGRHLYNIRYLEDKRAPVSYARTYQLSRDINWNGFARTGLYYTGKIPGKDAGGQLNSVIRELEPDGSVSVWEKNKQADETKNKDIHFPSIGILGKNAVFTSRNVTAAVISDMDIREDDNRYLWLYAETDQYGNIVGDDPVPDNNYIKAGPAGLFAVNEGAMENVAFDRSYVTGSDSTGTFCGENRRGGLKKLTLKKNGRVEGVVNVGGIAGKEAVSADDGRSSEKGIYRNLDNYGSVTGVERKDAAQNVKNVGGIVGLVSVAKGAVEFDSCRNYGEVSAQKDAGNDSDDRAGAEKIGGIAGYAENTTGTEENLKFANCSASPLYSDDVVEEILSDEDRLQKKLNGVYVGGIVGYNKGGRLEGCNGVNTGTADSYLFGYKYVGGIVGFNEGAVGSILDGQASVTDINVIGDSYVGGISGVNGKLSGNRDPEDQVPLPDAAADTHIRISNWVNQGVVAAAGNYAGGITGYNTGSLENCGSDVSADQTAKKITGIKTLQKGNYVGGIAGYNSGSVTSETLRKVVSYLTGSDYVGGVIGYNEADAELSGYSLLGGYVKSVGSFAGGLIGLNASEKLFARSEEAALASPLYANPNQVQGDFYVGGVIGGNLVSLGAGEDIYINIQVHNFLGSVEGAAYTGGHIGYNRLFEEGTSKERILEYSRIMDAQEEEADKWKDTTSGHVLTEKYAQLIKDVNALGGTDYQDSQARLAIVGMKGSAAGWVSLGNVTTDIFSGGIVGYNAEGTRLLIKNMVNRAMVRAKTIIDNRDENPMGKNANYSYSGGIISKVTKNAELDNCENQEERDNDSGGDYLGGICEINEGTVKNCPAPSIGRAGRSNVGGIAGLNKGTIENCSLGKNTTVTGESNVAGIVVENYGTITDVRLEGGTVRAFGHNAGGVAADNYGTIGFSSVMEGSAAVSAAEEYAGGIVGRNMPGPVEYTGKLTVGGTDRYVFSGSVSGQKYVGGIEGWQTNSFPLSNWKNTAVVTAEKGFAGGIVGWGATFWIQNCENTGTVSSSASGEAGGIAAHIAGGRILDCTGSGAVSAANGDGIAGGIAGAVEGTDIISCTVKGTGDNPVFVEGVQCIGGIAGKINYGGALEQCRVEHARISNTKNSAEYAEGSKIGGIAGQSYATVRKGLSDCRVGNSEILCCASGVNMSAGGIAGENDVYMADNTIEENSSVSLAEGAVYANLGGIVGYNKASVSGCDARAAVTGDMGSATCGYGGVAGVNEGVIENSMYSGTLRGNGSSDNMVSMGGIAGLNRSEKTTASIKGCEIGTVKDTVIACGDEASKKTAAGHVGGIVGQNSGSVVNSGTKDPEHQSYTVLVTNCAGNTGGIVGLQNSGATVETDTTGQNWTVSSLWYGGVSTGTGGIIGYCVSGNNIKGCRNYANVSSSYLESDNVAVGGLAGRLENNQRNGMIVEDFINYGDITGTMTGGAVGRVKYKGLTFVHCKNYGSITSSDKNKKSRGAGGLVANFFVVKESNDYIAFESCENHGNVTGKRDIGGIVGYTSADASVDMYFSDCVNSGALIVTPKDDSNTNNNKNFGGIMAQAGASGQHVYFYRCRNYGNVGYKEKSSSSIEARTEKNQSIIKSSKGTVTVQNCFNFGMPGGVYNGASNSYYINGSGDGTKLSYKKISDTYRSFYNESKEIIGGFRYQYPSSDVTNDFGEYDWNCTSASQARSAMRYRQQLVMDVDPHVVEYYNTLSSSVSGVKNLKITNIGGRLVVTWSHDGENYNEDQLMYKTERTTWVGDPKAYNTNTPITIAYGVQQYVLPLNANGKIQVAVRSVGGNYTRTTYDASWRTGNGPDSGKTETGAAAWAKAEMTALLPAQPTPKVYIELTPTDTDKRLFTAVLENAGDYKGEPDTVIEISGLKGVTNEKITFKASAGHSEPFRIDNNANANVSVVAKGTANCTDSLITTKIVALYGNDALNATDYVTTSFMDFYGDDRNGISSQIRMDSANDITELYMDTELVVDGYVIGQDSNGNDIALPVAVASGNAHVTDDGGTVTSVLNRLPEDFLDYGNITVRSYPWRSQESVCWYGHSVQSGISKADLLQFVSERSLKDAARNEAVFVQENGSTVLNDGYVLRRDADGNYSVIYSSILDYRDFYGKQVDEKVYTVDHKDRKVTGSNYSAKIQPEPVIEEEMTLSEDGSGYTFRWDTKNPDSSAVYEVQLVGHSAVSGDVVLGVQEVDASASKDTLFMCTFTDEDNSWNYTELTLSVVRKGTVDGSGKTKAFPASSARDFPAKMRFSQIPGPMLTLHRENGEVDKDTLIYDLTWDTVTEVQRADVKAYEVRVQAPLEDGTVQEEILSFTVDDLTAASATVQVDLNKYPPGQLLRFAVRAVAKEDAASYRDGVWGVVREMTLPSRQQVPDVTLMKSDPVYMEHEDGKTGTYMTAEEFAAGLALSLEDPEMTGIQGRYELAAAVYDQRPDMEAGGDHVDRSLVSAGDAPEKETDKVYWNSGAAKTLISKASRTDMNGNLSSAVYRLTSGLDETDAGKWLKIVLRNVSDSNVSSWWSDEDPDGETDNYCWVRIPRVQVNDMRPTEERTVLYYDMRTAQWSLRGSGSGYEAAVTQTTLRFAPASQGDCCRIQKVGLAKETRFADDVVYGRQDVDWIFLEPAEGKAGSYNVFMLSAQNGFPDAVKDLNSGAAPVCREDGRAVFVGEISSGGYVQLPVTDEVQLSGGDKSAIPVATLLIMTDTESGPVFDLVLPDGENVNVAGKDFADPVNYRTAQVSFQATVQGEEHLARYESGRISNWYRANDWNRWSTAVSTLETYSDPAATSLVLEVSGLKDIAYQVRASAKNRQVYQVTVFDRDQQTVLDRRYLGTYSGDDGDTQLLLLPEAVYGAYQGCFIRLQGADIIAGGSVSRWSLETEPMQLPLIDEPYVEYTISEQETTGTLTDGDGQAETLAVPGKRYTWVYDPARDVKINGYRLQIGGQYGDAVVYVLGSGQDGWYYVNEQGEQILLGEGTSLFEMTAQAVLANGNAISLSVPVVLSAAVREDGNTEFSLAVPGESVDADYAGEDGTGEQLRIAFDSKSEIFGWTYPPQ